MTRREDLQRALREAQARVVRAAFAAGFALGAATELTLQEAWMEWVTRDMPLVNEPATPED